MAWFYCECTKNIEHHNHICTLEKKPNHVYKTWIYDLNNECQERLYRSIYDYSSWTFLRLIDLISLQKYNFNNKIIDFENDEIVFEGTRNELLKLYKNSILDWFVREYEFKVENNELIFEVTISY